IYAQHVQASGAVDPAWPLDGRALCNAAGDQLFPTILSDGASGAFVTWQDVRTANADIYAQHVMATGAADPPCPPNPPALSPASRRHVRPTLESDGAGGAIVAWQDLRSGVYDIYAQRVARFGYLGTPEPVMASVRDVPNDQGGRVSLAWQASWLDTDPSAIVDHYWVLRSLTNAAAAGALARGERVFQLGRENEVAPVRGPVTASPRPLIIETTNTYYWEYLATVSALHFVDGYGYVAATTGDSTGVYNPPTYFMVVALNATET